MNWLVQGWVGIIFLLFAGIVEAQDPTYQVASGSIRFVSDAPMELIQARSDKVRGVLDLTSRTFLFTVALNSFQGFNNALQQDHFNENYLESEEFPEATFNGRIIETIDLTVPGQYDIRSKGQLTIHGVKSERIIRSQIDVSRGQIRVRSAFSVILSDHEIQVPRIVHQKIAEEIQVQVDLQLIGR